MAENDIDSIKTDAAGPAEASDDAGSVKQHSLKDRIDAHRYAKEVESQSSGGFPIKRTKVIPPGAS